MIPEAYIPRGAGYYPLRDLIESAVLLTDTPVVYATVITTPYCMSHFMCKY
jgi:hypothetical protein